MSVSHVVARCNFTAPPDLVTQAQKRRIPFTFLQLIAGDNIRLLSEERGWGYGYHEGKQSEPGLFPIKAIFYKRDYNSKHKERESLVREIEDTLEAWWPRIKLTLLTEATVHYLDDILGIMDELLTAKEKLDKWTEIAQSSDTRPYFTVQFSRLQQKIADLVDRGNRLLKFPMEVRKEDGTPYKLNELSVMSLFEKCVEKHKALDEKQEEFDTLSDVFPCASFSLLITYALTEFNSPFHCELHSALYDLDKSMYISTPSTLFWDASNKTFEGSGCVLFTDIEGSLNLHRIIVVTRLVKLSGNSATANGKNGPVPIETPTKRQFVGYDIRDLHGIIEWKNEKTLAVTMLICGRDEPLDATLERWHLGKSSRMGIAAGFEEFKLTLTTVASRGPIRPNLLKHPAWFAKKYQAISRPTRSTGASSELTRNSLLLTLVGGDFSLKSSDKKSLEMQLSVTDKSNHPIRDLFKVSDVYVSKFKSMMISCDEKTRWQELLEMRLPDRLTDGTFYLKFVFNVRKRDKKSEEPPFAFCFLKLIESGVIVEDGEHHLIVYKVDASKFELQSATFHTLPSTKKEAHALKGHVQLGPFSMSEKSSFSVRIENRSNVMHSSAQVKNILAACGTSDVRLLKSLNIEDKDKPSFARCGGQLLQALFGLWDASPTDGEIFKHIVDILHVYESESLKHLRASQLGYAVRTARPTTAIHILRALRDCARGDGRVFPMPTAVRAFRHLRWFGHAIVHSLKECKRLNYNPRPPPLAYLTEFMRACVATISNQVANSVLQNHLVKYLAQFFLPLTIYASQESEKPVEEQYIPLPLFSMAEFADEVMTALPRKNTNVMDFQKVAYVQQLIQTPLFKNPSTRGVIFQNCLVLLSDLMEIEDSNFNNQQKVSTTRYCAKTCLVLVELLFPTEHNATAVGRPKELLQIITMCLQPAICAALLLKNSILPVKVDDARAYLITFIVALLQNTSASAYNKYITAFNEDKPKLLVETLMMINDIFTKGAYINTWKLMNTRANRVIYQLLQYVQNIHKSITDIELFGELWREYMLSLMAFVMQASQSENISSDDQAFIEKALSELRSTWFMLGPVQKMQHIPTLVRDFLMVALTVEEEHGEIIKIITDMIRTEQTVNYTEDLMAQKTRREIFYQLDSLVGMEGRGRYEMKKQFMYFFEQALCQDCELGMADAMEFVVEVELLLDLLFAFRAAQASDNPELRMRAVEKLLRMYEKNEHNQLVVKYVYILYEMHMECNNYIEAANTLKIHTDMISFDKRELPDYVISSNRNRNCATERQLKAHLLLEMAELYSKGDAWEDAIYIYRQARTHYEMVFDYKKTAEILEKESELFKNISNVTRSHPFYYLVGFVGKGFPKHLDGKRFVYCSEKLERLNDFCERMTRTYEATLIDSGENPSNYEYSSGKYMQVVSLTPIPQAAPPSGVSDQILCYYNNYKVQKFVIKKTCKVKSNIWIPFCKTPTATDTMECFNRKRLIVAAEPLPGLVKFSQVTSISDDLFESPLELSVNNMKTANSQLANAVNKLLANPAHGTEEVSRLVSGICLAAVNGGIANYEPFYEPSLMANYTEECLLLVQELRAEVIKQVVIVELALYAHKQNATHVPTIHEHLESGFIAHRKYVEEHYGRIKDSMLPVSEQQEKPEEVPARMTRTRYSSSGGPILKRTSLQSDMLEQMFGKMDMGNGMDTIGRQPRLPQGPPPPLPERRLQPTSRDFLLSDRDRTLTRKHVRSHNKPLPPTPSQ